MEIKANEIVSIRHCSEAKLFKGMVLEKRLDNITVRLIEGIELLNWSDGDPIVLGFESESEVYLASCNILNIIAEEGKVILSIDNVDTLANKRLSERFPVSFYGDIHIGESQTKHVALVKNISFTGMLIFSKVDFPLYQKLKIDVDFGIVISLQAVIVRKSKELHNYEYGLKIVYSDVNTPNLLKKYLIHLKKEQQQFIKNISIAK